MQDPVWLSMLIGRYGAAIWGLFAILFGRYGIIFTDAETSQIISGASAILSVVLISISKLRKRDK